MGIEVASTVTEIQLQAASVAAVGLAVLLLIVVSWAWRVVRAVVMQ